MKETGEQHMEKGTIFWSGRRDKHAEGVGIYVRKQQRKNVLSFEGLSSRLAKMRLDSQWFKTS